MVERELSTGKVEAANRKPGGKAYPTGSAGGVAYPSGREKDDEPEEEQVLSILNEKGQEIPDSVPMEPPLGYSAGPSLADFVQRTVRGALSRIAEDQEMDTFEEAEDFDIEDDPVDPLTPYEKVFYGPPPSQLAPVPPAAKAEGGGAGEGVGSPKEADPAPVPTPNEKASK